MCLSAGFPSRCLVSKTVCNFWYDPCIFIYSNYIRSVFTTYLVVPWVLVAINLRTFKISSAFVFFQCEDCHPIKRKHLFFFTFFCAVSFCFYVCFCFVLCSTHPQTQQTLANLSPSPSALWKIIWFPPLYTIIADPFSTFMVYPGFFMSFKNSLVKCFMATGRQKRQPCKLVSSLICVSSFIKDII